MISDAELYRLNKEEGISYSELAKRYGLTRSAVSGRIGREKKRAALGNTNPKVENEHKDDEGASLSVTGNYATASSAGTRITNLDQLMEVCKIDTNEWVVERHVVNKWEVGRRDEQKEMTWEEGVLTGSETDNGKIFVEPLFQVKAWLVRKRPVEIKPTIKPVHVGAAQPINFSRRDGMKVALIIPDTQIGFSRDLRTGKLTPFHDRAAINIALQIAQEIQPDTTVFLGDLIDFSGWSDKWIKQPGFYFTTQPALIEAAYIVSCFRSLTRGDVHVIEGNHDLRPEKQIVTHLVDAYGLRSADHLDAGPIMSVPNLLGLDRMGVNYVGDYPSGSVWLNNTTRCIHGDKAKAPGMTAVDVVKTSSETVIFGHIHRRELSCRTEWTRSGPRAITAVSPGCLCHIDGRVPGSKRGEQWQQGLAIVWYDEHTSAICLIDIEGGKAVHNGSVYAGVDYVDALRKQSGWEF